MNFFQTILATMLQLIAPGHSVYSQVPIQSCNEACQKTPLCSNKSSWRCRPPKFSAQLYNDNLQSLKDQGMSVDKAMIEARLHSYTRPETYEEGLARYAIIAQGIAEVSQESTRSVCNHECYAASNTATAACNADSSCLDVVKQSAITCNNACLSSAPWVWSRKELAFMLATVTNQESGFREDVHGGTSLGDCRWAYNNGKTASPGSKGAHKVPGSCRSVCLGQNQIGNGKTKEGWTADDLTGVDLTSTKRCLTVTARNLARARLYCTRWNKSNGDWSKATFAAYGSGGSCSISLKKTIVKDGKRQTVYAYRVDDNGKPAIVWAPFPPDNAINKNPVEDSWPANRSHIFYTYMRTLHALDSDTQNLLAEPRMQLLIDTLKHADHMKRMIPIAPAQKQKPKDTEVKPVDIVATKEQ